MNEESIPWGTPESDDLLESLVLSENAQIYAMAREIKMSDTCRPYVYSAYLAISLSSWYALGHFLNKKFNMFARPRTFRILLYSFCGLFTMGSYVAVKDLTETSYERRVDDDLKRKSPIIIDGAKEFYDKLLLRNRSTRTLLGKAGQSHYTAIGNENYLFRRKHIPLLQRKEYFDQS